VIQHLFKPSLHPPDGSGGEGVTDIISYGCTSAGQVPAHSWKKELPKLAALFLLAEEEGFEPSSPVKVARFPVVCARPTTRLLHRLSLIVLYTYCASDARYKLYLKGKMAEREGFEPSRRMTRLTVFETASFGHSDTSPRHHHLHV
jgi:hypothetical protein